MFDFTVGKTFKVLNHDRMIGFVLCRQKDVNRTLNIILFQKDPCVDRGDKRTRFTFETGAFFLVELCQKSIISFVKTNQLDCQTLLVKQHALGQKFIDHLVIFELKIQLHFHRIDLPFKHKVPDIILAEIVRGGIMSIDDGQTEAGRSLGFNYMQTMWHIVFPQAFKAVLPALANEFVVLLKETSIAFYIGLGDLMYSVNAIRAATYSPFMPLVAAAIIYLVMVLALSKLVSILERRLRNSER